MQIQQIALDKLVPAKAPVRHTNGAKGKTNIEELAASIAAHGLLQNLVVSPSGKKFQVIAGNHRLAALELLAKKKGSGITGASKSPSSRARRPPTKSTAAAAWRSKASARRTAAPSRSPARTPTAKAGWQVWRER